MSPRGKERAGGGYGRWERKGRKVKVAVFKDLKRWEAREIAENYKALLNTKQLKKAKAGKKPRKGGAGG